MEVGGGGSGRESEGVAGWLDAVMYGLPGTGDLPLCVVDAWSGAGTEVMSWATVSLAFVGDLVGFPFILVVGGDCFFE